MVFSRFPVKKHCTKKKILAKVFQIQNGVPLGSYLSLNPFFLLFENLKVASFALQNPKKIRKSSPYPKKRRNAKKSKFPARNFRGFSCDIKKRCTIKERSARPRLDYANSKQHTVFLRGFF